MKRLLLGVLLALPMLSTSTGCKKEIPEYSCLEATVYSTKIQNANHNEPPILYWYIIQEKGVWYYLTNSTPKYVFNEVEWTKSKVFPIPEKDQHGKIGTVKIKRSDIRWPK